MHVSATLSTTWRGRSSSGSVVLKKQKENRNQNEKHRHEAGIKHRKPIESINANTVVASRNIRF